MEINSVELQKKIQNGEKVVVDFWAKWCGPCKVLKPTFEKVSQSIISEGKQVQMYTLDVEENRDLAVSLGIRAVPTIKAFSNGKEVFSQTGLQTDSQLKSLVENVLNG
jgi:thioredoxin 1